MCALIYNATALRGAAGATDGRTDRHTNGRTKLAEKAVSRHRIMNVRGSNNYIGRDDILSVTEELYSE